MPTISALKGFDDVLPSDAWKWQWVESIARYTATLFHFSEIRTPVVENADLFHRGVGETSDMVRKETFTFAGKSDQGESALQMTLRPEGTAGVARAMIEHGFLNDQGARAKVFYIAPNFRYEKPQKGRVRQHHQFGAEAFGVADPRQDVECILLQMQFYKSVGLKDLQLQINSLGDAQSKQNYRNMLVEFLTPKKASLSENSQRRLEENPLRILDSKDPRDKEACVGAPAAFDALSEKSREHFLTVQRLLTEAEVPFVVNSNLVRGFDYYTETLWEVTGRRIGFAERRGRGRAIRQPGRPTGWPPDSGRRFWLGNRAAVDCPGSPKRTAPPCRIGHWSGWRIMGPTR